MGKAQLLGSDISKHFVLKIVYLKTFRKDLGVKASQPKVLKHLTEEGIIEAELDRGYIRRIKREYLWSIFRMVAKKISEILSKLESLSNPEAVAGMARFGINPKNTYGVSIPNLRKMAKEIGKDHLLAQQLWSSGIREARIIAGMIDNPEMVTEDQMESWVKDFDSWDICDQCCTNLFEKTESAYQKCVEWSSREEEFVKRAGFVLMARLAVSDKKADDKQFVRFLPIIKRETTDDRNFVKKAINWALRQVGKRNTNLNKMAIKTAKEIRKTDSKTAKWIASDAIRELKSEAVQEKLQRQKRLHTSI
ncbi:MAG: DNA alkylation repair protein [Nitrososphaerales archaeon]